MTTRCPEVYKAIHRITAEFAKLGIPKLHTNVPDQYQYRSIDDLLCRLAPLLARHRLCVLPRVLKHRMQDRAGPQDSLLVSVRLLAAFDLVSARDGSSHTVQCWGEALDGGDKGTAKAMSSAYKYAMLELFCVPVTIDDPDTSSHRLKRSNPESEPDQGWSTWTEDIVDMIRICETVDALERVRTRHRRLLEALRREAPNQYARIGEAFADRGRQVAAPKPAAKRESEPKLVAHPEPRADKSVANKGKPVKQLDTVDG
jgi:hypothetical protein